MRIAVIPARGGSKRIPRKNIRPFCGRPMIAWPIATARASGLFSRILVSTDDAEIARIATECGAEVPFARPAELSNDTAATIPVMAHATRWLQSAGEQPASVCCIYATAAFITAEDLQRGADAIAAGKWSYAITVTRFGAPIFRAFRERPEGGLEMFFPEHAATRSQDLPVALHDAAQFYWGTPQAWLDATPIFGRHTQPIELPRWRVADIDDEDDWRRAEMMFQQLGGAP